MIIILFVVIIPFMQVHDICTNIEHEHAFRLTLSGFLLVDIIVKCFLLHLYFLSEYNLYNKTVNTDRNQSMIISSYISQSSGRHSISPTHSISNNLSCLSETKYLSCWGQSNVQYQKYNWHPGPKDHQQGLWT